MDLRHIKENATVFVVPSRLPANGYEARVSSVGRTYAYLDYRGHQVPFERATGRSHHPREPNVHANGCGFYVYANESDYLREQQELAEQTWLSDRLSQFGKIKKLPADVVKKIHRVLDDAKL